MKSPVFFVSVGPVVAAAWNGRTSPIWKQRSILKQSFFHEYGFILTRTRKCPLHPPADVLLEFSMALAESRRRRQLAGRTGFTVHLCQVM